MWVRVITISKNGSSVNPFKSWPSDQAINSHYVSKVMSSRKTKTQTVSVQFDIQSSENMTRFLHLRTSNEEGLSGVFVTKIAWKKLRSLTMYKWEFYHLRLNSYVFLIIFVTRLGKNYPFSTYHGGNIISHDCGPQSCVTTWCMNVSFVRTTPVMVNWHCVHAISKSKISMNKTA